MLSIKEVARITGLSTATVSRALDPRYADKVKPETRKKIIEVCDSGNYRPGIAGRSFVTGKSYKVGFISGAAADDFGNLLQGFFFQGLGFELQRSGYNLLLLCAPDTDEKSDLVVDFLRSGVADAYIMGTSLLTEKVRQALDECHVPVVCLSRSLGAENGIEIDVDIRPAYREIWKRIPEDLLDKTLYCCRNREEKKFKIASELSPPGFVLPFAELPTSCNFSEVRAHAAAAAASLIEKLLQYKIFWCSSDLMALGIKDVFERRGLIAGKDYYLIGHDNIEALSSYSGTPFLSTVDGAWEKEGICAAQMVLEALNGKKMQSLNFPLDYISRESFPF